ncbi:HD domain-containing protein [Xanthocytophaga flava]|uniref:HD domain-containing protein n=1 Tax=Xanthocytophaga flava TaxID=3048013 RepID=UPI0028D087B4|nr:hypothetical protein [Xanthocytophaga flavus]MDJ1470316.1 hypothetical protein [Xanthocytophaga flavus]
MNYKELLKEIESYVESLFHIAVDSLPYHNLEHTQQVVNQAKQIIAHYPLDETQVFMVCSAAWFHDVGYLTGPAAGHEERSMEVASVFLQGRQIPSALIKRIQACILSTKLPQKPHTLLEQIICDADLYHFGTDAFFTQDALMHAEVSKGNLPPSEWIKGTIRLLESHTFFTTYCQQTLNEKKKLNLKKLYDCLVWSAVYKAKP